MSPYQYTFTTFCASGLCNRLNVLVSGLALAEASERKFRMLWPRTPACGASFHELFINDWPVEEVPQAVLKTMPIDRWERKPPDLLVASAEDVVLGSHRNLVRPDLYPNHARLEARRLAYFGQLQPTESINAAVGIYKQRHFRPTMIGVHLRRGDFSTHTPDTFVNTTAALAAVENALVHLPEAGIFLASDDGAPTPQQVQTVAEGVRELFVHRFGERVIWTSPRSLVRASTEAVQDGLVDLWLLRQTDYFIGSAGSTFSGLAIYGRNVPHVICSGMTPVQRGMLRLYKISGIYHLLIWLGGREFRRTTPPFSHLLRRYRENPSLALQALFRHQPKDPGQ